MNDPSDALQAAIYAKLAAAAGVQAVLGSTVRVYDKVPFDPTYPYTRIGEDQVLGRANPCADGWEVFATLHTFSRHATAPRPEVKVIHNALALALTDEDALPAPTGFQIAESNLESSRVFFDDDGIVAHGVMTIRYLVADGA